MAVLVLIEQMNKIKIKIKMINLLLHLMNLETEILAAEIFDIQDKLNFAGLVGQIVQEIVRNILSTRFC